VCVYVAAETCLSVLLSPHEPHRGHRFLQFVLCRCAYTLPRKRVYLFVLLSPHEPYRGHRFLQLFCCKCANTLPRKQVEVKVKVTLRLTVGQSVSLGIEPHLGLMTRYLLLFGSYGSNTSTVTLRVVGGDGKGSLKSETVKYGHEFRGTRTRERRTTLSRASSIYKRQTRPLVREGATEKQDRNCQRAINIW
jgi:hypothetical protein